MIPAPYVWLVWSSAFLLPWAFLYWRYPAHRPAMLWGSVFTTPFGLTEPLFVPEYWAPPSLFDLARRTGFDLESLIFCFGIGGVGAVLVNVLTHRVPERLAPAERHQGRHRFHRWALVAPFLMFALLLPLGWNPIYPGVVAMTIGAALTAWCRPDLARHLVLGALVFLSYYMVFLAGLELTAPRDYIETVWNLDALSGVWIGFMPLEELLFAAAFGAYWAGVYQHFGWRTAVRPDRPRGASDPEAPRTARPRERRRRPAPVTAVAARAIEPWSGTERSPRHDQHRRPLTCHRLIRQVAGSTDPAAAHPAIQRLNQTVGVMLLLYPRP